jgi:phosphatidylserine decarboxylase
VSVIAEEARAASDLRARMFVALQHLVPQHTATGIVHRLTRSRRTWLKNLLIRGFLRGFRPDMSEALEPNALAYPTFNEFFTRPLRPGARPIATDARTVVSPVDGAVSQIGRIDRDRIVQAKGHDYTVESLLAGAAPWVERFAGGAFATLYLAPYDYHRIHMPLPGGLREAWYVPGQLFSVNQLTASAVPGLFARNERVVCMFEDGDLAFAMILVGALFVGSMSTVWHGDVTPCRPQTRESLLPVEHAAPLALPKGAEMGRFNMGSTVILLFPANRVQWNGSLGPGRKLRMGEPIGRLA